MASLISSYLDGFKIGLIFVWRRYCSMIFIQKRVSLLTFAETPIWRIVFVERFDIMSCWSRRWMITFIYKRVADPFYGRANPGRRFALPWAITLRPVGAKRPSPARGGGATNAAGRITRGRRSLRASRRSGTGSMATRWR